MSLLTFENVLFVLPFVVTGGIFLYRTFSKQSVEIKAARLSDVQVFGRLAYASVSEIARRTETKVDDKVAQALLKICESLEAKGQPPLSESEEAHAKQLFDALHLEENRFPSLGQTGGTLTSSPK